MSERKTYTAPQPPLAEGLVPAIIEDPAIAGAGVTVLEVNVTTGSTQVEVVAEQDPTPANAEIQAVIDAHDPTADYPFSAIIWTGAMFPSFPFIGAFSSADDLPSPTFIGATALAAGLAYCRNPAGEWVVTGPGTLATVISQCATAQAGGEPIDVSPSYSQLSGCAWDGTNFLRSTGSSPAWHARAYAGRLTVEGDRISFPNWAAEPDGGNFGVLLMPPGTVPSPQAGSSINAVWGGQWVGGFSLVSESNGTRWRMRGNGSQGSGFPSSGPRIEDGQTLSVSVASSGKIEAWVKASKRDSSFTVGAGLDVWVVFESVAQRWPGAYKVTTALPDPGTPGGPGTIVYQPTTALRLDGSNDIVSIPNAGIGNALRWDLDWTIGVRFPLASEIDTVLNQTLLSRGTFNGIGIVRSGSVYRVTANGPGSADQSFPTTVDLDGARVFFDYDAGTRALRVWVNDDLRATLTIASNTNPAGVVAAGMTFGAMAYGSSSFWGWGGLVHELFTMDRRMTAAERADVMANGNLADASWYADVVGWWPLGTGDTHPTMRNVVPGGSDGTLINATPSALEEL